MVQLLGERLDGGSWRGGWHQEGIQRVEVALSGGAGKLGGIRKERRGRGQREMGLMLVELLKGGSWNGGWYQEGTQGVEVEVGDRDGRGGVAARRDKKGERAKERSCMARFQRAGARACGIRKERRGCG